MDLSALVAGVRAGSGGFTELAMAGTTAGCGAPCLADFSAVATAGAGAGAAVCGVSLDWASAFALELSGFGACGAISAFGGIAGVSADSWARCHKSTSGG